MVEGVEGIFMYNTISEGKFSKNIRTYDFI